MTTSAVTLSTDSTLAAEGVQSTSLVPVNRAITVRTPQATDNDTYVRSSGAASTGSTRSRSRVKRPSTSQDGSGRVKYLNSSSVTRLSGGPKPTGMAAAQYWFYANLLSAGACPPQFSLYA